MTMAAGLIWMCIIMAAGGVAIVAFALWLRSREENSSILDILHDIRVTPRQYEKFASGARFWMYSSAFLGGIASAKGDRSMEIACVSIFLGMQVVMYWMRSRRFGSGWNGK